jgi:hypothetical protein
MKSSILFVSAFALSSLLVAVSPALAQGTAFTYQGRLNDGTNPANGKYDLLFVVYDAAFAGSQRGPIVTNTATAVTDGLFSVELNFGPDVFIGPNLWLEIGVQTNGSGSGFTILSPRQQILPSPYAIMASTASTANTLLGTLPTTQLSGTVANSQLANSNLTVNPGPGLSGGGTVALGGSMTLANAGVLSVIGNSDITASTAAGAVTLGSTATSANTPNAIMKRDLSGNFAAGSLTLSGTNFASDFRLANGSQSAVSALETLRIVRGNVQSGTNFNGAGFTVRRTGTGAYTVNFTPAFADTPSVICQFLNGSAGTATATFVSPTQFTVITAVGFSLADSNFSFLAVGAR